MFFGSRQTLRVNERQRSNRDKTIADRLMYIPDDDTQNYTFSRFRLVVEKFEHFMNQQIKIRWKSPKLLSQPIRKHYYKTLGTRYQINSPLSPLSLLICLSFCLSLSIHRKDNFVDHNTMQWESISIQRPLSYPLCKVFVCLLKISPTTEPDWVIFLEKLQIYPKMNGFKLFYYQITVFKVVFGYFSSPFE